MDKLMGILIIVPLCFAAANHTLAETIQAMLDGANSAFGMVISFAGVMCLWTGIMRVGECAGTDKIFSVLLKPVIRLLFPGLKEDDDAVKYINLNISANILGIANGATPMGIKAMQELDRNNPKKATRDMCTFMVLNTASFQLIPTSIMALRSAAGGTAGIIVPIWITSLVSLTVGVLTVRLLFLFKT